MLETIAIGIGCVVMSLVCVAIIMGTALAAFLFAHMLRQKYVTGRMFKRLKQDVALNSIKGIWTSLEVLRRYNVSDRTISQIEQALCSYRDRYNIDRDKLRNILNSIKINEP